MSVLTDAEMQSKVAEFKESIKDKTMEELESIEQDLKIGKKHLKQFVNFLIRKKLHGMLDLLLLGFMNSGNKKKIQRRFHLLYLN